MSEPASISAGIAGRYASAIFDLAQEGKALADLEADVAALAGALDVSEDLRDMIASPVVTREDQARAIAAVGKALKLTPTMSNALALMAGRRRLFVLPQMLQALRDRIATEKGEVTAQVRSATDLSAEQRTRLAEVLSASTGRTVRIHATVEPALIGGLVVKVGSRMIDTSIRAQLAGLQNAMKEVG